MLEDGELNNNNFSVLFQLSMTIKTNEILFMSAKAVVGLAFLGGVGYGIKLAVNPYPPPDSLAPGSPAPGIDYTLIGDMIRNAPREEPVNYWIILAIVFFLLLIAALIMFGLYRIKKRRLHNKLTVLQDRMRVFFENKLAKERTPTNGITKNVKEAVATVKRQLLHRLDKLPDSNENKVFKDMVENVLNAKADFETAEYLRDLIHDVFVIEATSPENKNGSKIE